MSERGYPLPLGQPVVQSGEGLFSEHIRPTLDSLSEYILETRRRLAAASLIAGNVIYMRSM
jgi:hypothetical protein